MSQVLLLLNKAYKSYGVLFRRQCYIYTTRKKIDAEIQKSGKSYKRFDTPFLLGAVTTGSVPDPLSSRRL